MKERPILFSGEMVRAILEGRKTQTRRIVKDGTPDDWNACPYGVIGDRLWVRETWRLWDVLENYVGGQNTATVQYKAGPLGSDRVLTVSDEQRGNLSNLENDRWRPSIFMPRWASRITLEITGVRVERLQEITEKDALAEGVGYAITRDCKVPQFARLWDQINGKHAPWESNPWVWVVEFKRVSNGTI